MAPDMRQTPPAKVIDFPAQSSIDLINLSAQPSINFTYFLLQPAIPIINFLAEEDSLGVNLGMNRIERRPHFHKH
ncbi:hypothetical protein KBI23_09200 [bacterium]|nr:hypothetical protein [bacterium]MBP9810573.1 hypothetical protein [bacterium]